MKKYLVIVNPSAGKGRGKKIIPYLRDYLKNSSLIHRILVSKTSGQVKEIVSRISKYFSHIIVVGGDGTLNEAINGADLQSGKVIGIIPVGTGNDFVKNLNFPRNISESIKLVFNDNYQLYDFDLGLIEYKESSDDKTFRHIFINSVGIGFDALVAKINQKTTYLKGIFSYGYALLKAISLYHPIKASISFFHQKVKGEKLLIMIGNGVSSGGGFYLTPDAKINDGLLNFCIISKVSILRMLRSLPKALYKKIHTVKEVLSIHSNRAQITLEDPYIIHADGEIISEAMLTANISLINTNLKVIGGPYAP